MNRLTPEPFITCDGEVASREVEINPCPKLQFGWFEIQHIKRCSRIQPNKIQMKKVVLLITRQYIYELKCEFILNTSNKELKYKYTIYS